MSETVKVKGPALYFPSIEKTYGKPISHWIGILKRPVSSNICNW